METDSAQKINFALESFKNIQSLIRFIDQKAGLAFVVCGLICGAVIQLDGKFPFSNDISSFLMLGFLISGVCTISAMLISVAMLFKVLKPRLAQNYNPDEFSLFYFGHLAEMGRDSICKGTDALSTSSIINELSGQINEVSKIMVKKTKNLSRAFPALLLSILFLVFHGVFWVIAII